MADVGRIEIGRTCSGEYDGPPGKGHDREGPQSARYVFSSLLSFEIFCFVLTKWERHIGMVRINFQPYSTPQLEQIVKSRLLSAKEGVSEGSAPDVIAPDGIKFAAMKVSSISGDARRVLDICRYVLQVQEI